MAQVARQRKTTGKTILNPCCAMPGNIWDSTGFLFVGSASLNMSLENHHSCLSLSNVNVRLSDIEFVNK